MAFLTAMVELLRRALVRRELEAAVRPAGVEGRRSTFYVDLMKEAGPPGASANGFNENLALFQTASAACGSTPRSPLRSSPTRRQSPGRRQGRLRAGARQRPRQARQLAVGLGLAIPAGIAEGRRGREVRRLGDLARTTSSWSPRRKAGPNVPPGTRNVALRERRVPEGGAVRQDDARTRSTRPTRPSRPSSRCPMSACSSSPSPSSRASARRSASSSRRRWPARSRVDAGAASRRRQLTEREMTKAGYIK